ncbi:MAG: GNAT family N-acetyltransferase [Acidimicrobiales bacterium]
MARTSTGPPASIRRATADDLELVLRRRLAFLAELREVAEPSLAPDFVATTRRFLERTHCTSFLSWIAEIDQHDVGIVSIIISDAPPRPEELRDLDGYVVNMHVDAPYRSQGIGRLLLDRAVADSAAMGVRRFTLHTTEDGRPLYESTGFTEEPGWMQRYL